MSPCPFHRSRREALRGAGAIALLAVCAAAGAQQAPAANGYPNRPVKVVVPWPPGNSADTVARLLTQDLTKRYGQPFVIENRPGAGATLGTAQVATAPADGYTLLVTNAGPLVLAPAVRASVPYDPVDGFQPVAVAGYVGSLLVVTPDFPVKSVPELIAYLKANPGKFSHASTGKGSFGHLHMERFKRQFGTDTAHVPFSGDAQVINEMKAGRIHVAFSSIAVSAGAAKAGNVKVLATSAVARTPFAPDAPTIMEATGHDFGAPTGQGVWLGLLAPAGTPPPIVAALNAAVNDIVRMPAFRQALQTQYLLPAEPLTPAAFKAMLVTNLDTFKRVAEQASARESD